MNYGDFFLCSVLMKISANGFTADAFATGHKMVSCLLARLLTVSLLSILFKNRTLAYSMLDLITLISSQIILSTVPNSTTNI